MANYICKYYRSKLLSWLSQAGTGANCLQILCMPNTSLPAQDRAYCINMAAHLFYGTWVYINLSTGIKAMSDYLGAWCPQTLVAVLGILNKLPASPHLISVYKGGEWRGKERGSWVGEALSISGDLQRSGNTTFTWYFNHLLSCLQVLLPFLYSYPILEIFLSSKLNAMTLCWTVSYLYPF